MSGGHDITGVSIRTPIVRYLKAGTKDKPKTTAKTAPKAATGATKKKTARVVPKNVKKLMTHRSTRPLWAKIRRSAKLFFHGRLVDDFFFGFKHHFF
ncbi:unnamed protein product [Oppiella nova]|uniref:Uncharacterized protein n=1 Tax=Oppiella nova TaxID=334625 RepID=A0A7R9QJB0_9ACAR|nr:unnamed protein product [Oppiella nova]CAG2166980.1 unnamed protein product [Oppiella nova]